MVHVTADGLSPVHQRYYSLGTQGYGTIAAALQALRAVTKAPPAKASNKGLASATVATVRRIRFGSLSEGILAATYRGVCVLLLLDY